MLHELAKLCHNVKELETDFCDDETSGLITLIKVQSNLQNLCLYINNNVENQAILLSNVIKEKENLKRITLKPNILLIPPTFIPSLKKLQYLILNNEEGQVFYEDKKWNDWEYFLSKAFFTDLRYLEIMNLPNNIECLIIERSGGKLSDIIVCHLLERQGSHRTRPTTKN
ncbi:hypothetical protein RclHR1_04170011 [Rhizophagus clarus]|nr:hypothetical protein RclHR1_04170011 [Rhizophagus clarus]